MRKTMRQQRPDRIPSTTSANTTRTSPTTSTNDTQILAAAAARAAQALTITRDAAAATKVHTNTRGKPPSDGTFKSHTLRNRTTPTPPQATERRSGAPPTATSSTLLGLHPTFTTTRTAAAPSDAEPAWHKVRAWQHVWRAKQQNRQREKAHEKLKAQISAPLPVARGLPSTALALLAGDGGVQRARRLTPLETMGVGTVPAVVRVQDRAVVGPAVGSTDERAAVERKVVKGPIRLDVGDGLGGERRDTMFGDFMKTPPETPRAHEVARAKNGDTGVAECADKTLYGASEPVVIGKRSPLQSNLPEIPPRVAEGAPPPLPPLPPVPRKYAVSYLRANTMQRTYTLPGNPFADFDGVHRHALPKEPADHASRESWESCGRCSVSSDGNMSPLVSGGELGGEGAVYEEAYEPPRKRWVKRDWMNGGVEVAGDEGAGTRDTRFYEFYDELLDGKKRR